jgi:hypothetical protein
MRKRFAATAVVMILAFTFLLAAFPRAGRADAPVREVTIWSAVGDLTQTSSVDLKYTRDSDGQLVCQSYLLIEPPDPVATMVLFVGGAGRLGIADGGLSFLVSNFNWRVRHHLAAGGPFNIALIDAPYEGLDDIGDNCSGRSGDLRPLDYPFRVSDAHLEDIETALADLRTTVAEFQPLYLNGTSRGAISAALAAANIIGPAAPDGLILSSSASQRSGPDLLDVALENISVPSLVVGHKRDTCEVTPPSDIPVIKQRLRAGGAKVRTRLFFGGDLEPLTGACSALSPHGFFGIETIVADFMVRWTKWRIALSHWPLHAHR